MPAPINKKDISFTPNVVQVWVEEPNFTGYKGLDFTRIDQIEDLLRSGINVNIAGQTVGVTGSVAVTNSDITSLKNSLNNVIFSDTNAPSGVVVYQSNLNKDLDNVTAIVSGFNPLIFSDPATNTPSGMIVYQTNLNKDLDNVTAVPERNSTISSSAPFSSPGLAIAENSNRKELYIQNLSTNKLYVKYGQNATSDSFNFILAKNTEIDAGDGGSISDQSYTGIVTVFGTSPRYIAWERS